VVLTAWSLGLSELVQAKAVLSVVVTVIVPIRQ
jgi:hypothetical protein